MVAVVVVVNVVAGGMRSITFVQAFQYWLKLTALLVPLVFLLLASGAPTAALTGRRRRAWRAVVGAGTAAASGVEHPVYATYSLMLATFLGTMGLPHVLVRFYTNPDGRAARRTTLVVLALLGGFYLCPPIYGALGRVYAPDLLVAGAPTPSCWSCRADARRHRGGDAAGGAADRRRVRGVPVHVVGLTCRWPGCSARTCSPGARRRRRARSGSPPWSR